MKLDQSHYKDGWHNGGNSKTYEYLMTQSFVSMTTLLDHKSTLKYLAYLGFEGDTRTALKVTKPKRIDRKKGKIQRNVFSCYVFGAPGSGKV
jgi:hypothetical protein